MEGVKTSRDKVTSTLRILKPESCKVVHKHKHHSAADNDTMPCRQMLQKEALETEQVIVGEECAS